MTLEEQRWHEDKVRYRWELPPKGAWPFRLPGIRRLRAALHLSLARWTADLFRDAGDGDGQITPYDRWIIFAIRRGWY